MRLKGVAPVAFHRVPPGEVILCVVHEGFKPKIVRFQFDPATPQKKHVELEPLKNSILSKYLFPAKSELGAKKMSVNLVDASKEIGVDLMVMTYIEVKSPAEATVSMFLFDKRIKKKLKEITKTFNPQNYSHEEIQSFVGSLFKGVDLSGIVVKPKPKIKTPPPVSVWTKMFKSKYFLPIVGGIGGSLILGAVVTGVYLYTDKPSKPPIGGKIVLGY